MSWNKNTISASKIDTTIELLKELGFKYNLTELGKVEGNGLNDIDNTNYPIRKLEYNQVVILEKMIRSEDCDENDIIRSFKFKKKDVPKKWKIEEISKD
jgi:hypothetical protein